MCNYVKISVYEFWNGRVHICIAFLEQMISLTLLQVDLLIPASHNLVVDAASVYHIKRVIIVTVTRVTLEKLVKLIMVRYFGA